MKKFIFTYETSYQNGTFKEEYSVKADSQNEAEYIVSFGAGDLESTSKGIGRIQSMKLINIEEK